jgi:hypothetical protein
MCRLVQALVDLLLPLTDDEVEYYEMAASLRENVGPRC